MATRSEDAPSPGPIAVLLADLPGLLAEVLTAMIQARADLSLAGVFNGDPAALALAAPFADVLLVGGPSPPPGSPPPLAYTPLLHTAPGLRIIVLATGDDRADLFWLGLRHRQEPITSANHLADVVREAMAIDPYRLP